MTANPDLTTLRDLRRDLHAHPETAGGEERTAERVARFLANHGPAALLRGLGGHGLAAVFEGKTAGPTVVLRAELDALPIHETGTVGYASRRAGAGHLCGHDGHLAMLCGVAPWLGQRGLERGRVVLLAQPAEETGEGARRVTADPRYRDLAPDRVFALHNLPGHRRGQILVRAGAFTAGSVGIVIRLSGRTAHAAYPEQGLSPTQAMADLVTDLVTLPLPHEAAGRLALVTVVHARLGDVAFGTSPGEAEVMATMRADSGAVLSTLREEAERLAREVAARDELEVAIDWVEEFPVTANHPDATAEAADAARTAGLLVAEPEENPFRWSEDFGWFIRRVPGALIGLGAGRQQPVLHAPDYDFPDELIAVGVRFWAALLTRLGLTAPESV